MICTASIVRDLSAPILGVTSVHRSLVQFISSSNTSSIERSEYVTLIDSIVHRLRFNPSWADLFLHVILSISFQFFGFRFFVFRGFVSLVFAHLARTNRSLSSKVCSSVSTIQALSAFARESNLAMCDPVLHNKARSMLSCIDLVKISTDNVKNTVNLDRFTTGIVSLLCAFARCANMRFRSTSFALSIASFHLQVRLRSTQRSSKALLTSCCFAMRWQSATAACSLRGASCL